MPPPLYVCDIHSQLSLLSAAIDKLLLSAATHMSDSQEVVRRIDADWF